MARSTVCTDHDWWGCAMTTTIQPPTHGTNGKAVIVSPTAAKPNGKAAASTTSVQPNKPTQYKLAKFQADLLKVDRKICHDRKSPFSFLVLPAKDGQEGLFPVAEISMFAGASGAWKTTVELLFFKQWEKSEQFFGRPTCVGDGKYLIVSFDRSKEGFARGLSRLV